jgi:hypothetical protein
MPLNPRFVIFVIFCNGITFSPSFSVYSAGAYVMAILITAKTFFQLSLLFNSDYLFFRCARIAAVPSLEQKLFCVRRRKKWVPLRFKNPSKSCCF